MSPPSIPPRVDARDKVTGQAIFSEDLPDLPGTLIAASIRSPYSHARILAVNSAAAEAMPGVVGVIHRDRLAGMDIHRQPGTIQQEFLTTDKARFDGDLIGLVVAEDLRTARTAAAAVDVAYEVLQPVLSYEEAMAESAPTVHDDLGHNLALTMSLEWGDVEDGFRQAAHIVEGSYFTPAAYHHPMEPASSFTVRWENGTVDVWAPVHKLFDVQAEAAHLLGVEPGQVRVRVPYIGGSFGGKDVTSPEIHATALLSRKLGRPVKFVATEEEGFRVNSRHAMTYRARMGVAADGRITAMDVELELDTGAYFTGAGVVTGNALESAMGGYRVPNLRVVAQTAYTNKVPAATFRSTGRSQTTFGLECLADVAARAAGISPLDFRVRNVVRRGEALCPPIVLRDGKEAPSEWPPMDADVDEIIQKAAELLGTPQARPGKTTGQGLAISFRRSSRSGDADAALELSPDGMITVLHNAPDLGEGSHTVLQILAAKALGVPPDMVRISEPDTANGLYFTGVSSQRTTMQMGAAVVQAAGELREALFAAVGRLHESPPDAWRLVEGTLVGPDGAMVELKELAASLRPSDAVEGKGRFRTKEARVSGGMGRDHWTAGGAAAEVEIDTDTGQLRLLRYAAIADAGTALHPPSAQAQVEGGAILGIGLSLLEEVVYGDGRMQNGDAVQYPLPLARHVPAEFLVGMLEKGDGPGPYGSKAMAQTSVPCVVPAMANAVYQATGSRLMQAPFTPERVLRALGTI